MFLATQILIDAKGNLFVQMGILRSQVNISDLELIEEPLTVTAKQMRRTSSGKMKMGKSMHVSPEINLLGKTVDEAVAELDKYLDDAYIAVLLSDALGRPLDENSFFTKKDIELVADGLNLEMHPNP